MKLLLLTTAIWITWVIGCVPKDPNLKIITASVRTDTPIFHIKVASFLGAGCYCIHFTNDNWKTSEDIYETFDLTDGEQPVYVCWQTKLFDPIDGGCEAAIAFARHFKTYQSCTYYNARTHDAADRLKQYYLLHPPPERKRYEPTCNLETNIY